MTLNPKDVELIEKIIYRNGDDIAVSIARSFERLEERVNACETRLASRVADVEDKIESARQDIVDELSDVKAEVRDLQSTLADVADDHKSLREAVTA